MKGRNQIIPICIWHNPYCKILSRLYQKTDEHSKTHMAVQKSLNSQNNPNKNNNTEDLATHGYKLYLRDSVTKTMWHSQENRHLEQGNKIEKPGLRPCNSY